MGRISARAPAFRHETDPVGFRMLRLMRSHTHRRGNCLFLTLVGLAVLGLLVLIASLVAAVTSKPGEAVQQLESQIQTLAESATRLEAPGSAEVELAKGGVMVLLAPDGEVDGKKISTPGGSVQFDVTITGEDGTEVKVEAMRQPRDPNSPFAVLAAAEIPADGTYTVDVRETGGGETPAAILVAGGSQADLEAMGESAGELAKFAGGACGGVCGLVLLLGCGIPALVIAIRRRKPKVDPLAQL